MSIKIEGSENISNVFSIFHDGDIVNGHQKNSSLLIEVEIQYLAERINPPFRKFMLRLDNVRNLHFSTWPSDWKSEPKVLRDAKTIFKSELGILEGNYEEDQIKVACDQHLPEFDYCGGELHFSATSVEVTDEAGKGYSIEELGALCKDYWDEWANNKS
ncbi:hypothetical protein [Acaryochloris marina]|uniref:hypothetical protein n=1 Tax=Acaryochloris marina TaxID=155978 RepID=UPI001BAFF0E9|nr:hypothetical protein [Acaryochloris marina]QUY43518.1 hypothetical protein I1H34_05110 [Acaryochloris marina S15]